MSSNNNYSYNNNNNNNNNSDSRFVIVCALDLQCMPIYNQSMSAQNSKCVASGDLKRRKRG